MAQVQDNQAASTEAEVHAVPKPTAKKGKKAKATKKAAPVKATKTPKAKPPKKEKATKVKATPKPKAERKPKAPKVAPEKMADLQFAVERAAEDVKEEGRLVIAASSRLAVAKAAYAKALAPYREACKTAGQKCEFARARGANVAPATRFNVELTDRGILVELVGKTGTSETLPWPDIPQGINKFAYGYCDRHIGPRAEIGNKGGGLGNRLRKMAEKRGSLQA